ncbi:MAG: hypothetical protein ACKV1O_26375 [Saprospiraceae bacterium]
MKITKKAFQFLILGLALILSNALYAQSGEGKQGRGQKEPMTAEQRAQKMTDRQKTELGLDDAQYQKVLDINKKHAAKMDGIRKKSRAEREKQKAEMQTLEASRQADLNKVLTPEQYEKFKMNKEKKKEKMKARKGGHPGKGKAPGKQED